jgi:hypothetical protein
LPDFFKFKNSSLKEKRKGNNFCKFE